MMLIRPFRASALPQTITVTLRQRQKIDYVRIVQGNYHSQPFTPRQLANFIQQPNLVLQIEMCGRLIQKKNRGVLGQGARQEHHERSQFARKDGTWYFVITAYDTSYNESSAGVEVSKEIVRPAVRLVRQVA